MEKFNIIITIKLFSRSFRFALAKFRSQTIKISQPYYTINYHRSKRSVDLTPDEVLELLNLYEKNQRALQKLDVYDNIDENDDEAWY